MFNEQLLYSKHSACITQGILPQLLSASCTDEETAACIFMACQRSNQDLKETVWLQGTLPLGGSTCIQKGLVCLAGTIQWHAHTPAGDR